MVVAGVLELWGVQVCVWGVQALAACLNPRSLGMGTANFPGKTPLVLLY
jgi:hypothetical protein